MPDTNGVNSNLSEFASSTYIVESKVALSLSSMDECIDDSLLTGFIEVLGSFGTTRSLVDEADLSSFLLLFCHTYIPSLED